MRYKKVGIVGAGAVGRKRITSSFELDLEVKWISDTDEKAIKSACTDFSIDQLNYDDPTWEDVDLIIVSTSHSSLKPCSQKFIEREIPVLVEKPAGITLGEIQELVTLSKVKGVEIYIGHNYRFHPSVQKLKSILEKEQFGSLLKVRVRHGHGAREGYEKEWRCDKKVSGGGELVDQGCHLIDLCKFLFGELSYEHSYLSTKFWDSEVEDDCFLHLKTGSDADVFLFASWYEWRNIFSFEVFFEKAKFEIQGFNGSYGLETLKCFFQNDYLGPPEIQIFEYARPDASWTNELNGIVNGEDKDNAKIFDALNTWKIVDTVYKKNGY